jgi:hypothetical protein
MSRLARAARAWGATDTEARAQHAADLHVPPGGEHLVRAVDVDAPPEVVFRWLCQIRVAPYSYDLLDNLGRRSPRTLTPGADELALGQRFQIGPLVAFEPGRMLAFEAGPAGRRAFGPIAMSYDVAPGLRARSRIVACVALGPRRRLSLGVTRSLLAVGDLVMIRKQLLTLRDLAEGSARESG